MNICFNRLKADMLQFLLFAVRQMVGWKFLAHAGVGGFLHLDKG
jgi:hypothetical protein